MEAFTAQDADSYGLNAMALSRMVERGDLVRIRQGYYAVTEPIEDGRRTDASSHGAKIAALAAPPLYGGGERVICLETAACLHGLTTEHIGDLFLGVRWGQRVFRRGGADQPLMVRVFQWSDDRMFRVGVDQVEMYGRNVWLTDKARTVVDLLRYADDPRVGMAIAREALQTFVAQGGREADVMDAADKLGMVDVVRPYVIGAWRQDR
jgi:predicted transcriptional regulator of viral defense system